MSSYVATYIINTFMIIIFIAVLIFFVGKIGQEALCASRDFMKSAIEPSSFCIMKSTLLIWINKEAIHVTSTVEPPLYGQSGFRGCP